MSEPQIDREQREAKDFDLAMRAFDKFTLAERKLALEEFASLRYPSIVGRFFEAVHRVVVAHQAIPR